MCDSVVEFLCELLSSVHHPDCMIKSIRLKRTSKDDDNKDDNNNNTKNVPIKETFDIALHRKELIMWNTFSAIAIDHTYPIDKLHQSPAKNDEKLMNDLKYCIKYATYAYYMPILGKPKENNLTIKKNNISFLGYRSDSSHHRIHSLLRNIVLGKWRFWKNEHVPGYFIGVDKDKKIILLCIRGTASIGDVNTDLDAKSERKNFGDINTPKYYYCHKGVKYISTYNYMISINFFFCILMINFVTNKDI